MIIEFITMWPTLPVEFFIVGIPVSLQASPRSKNEWKDRVRSAAVASLPSGSWALTGIRLSVAIVYFPVEQMDGDVDNRIKLILDGMKPNVLLDDDIVDRVMAQRIQPDEDVTFAEPTPTLTAAMASADPTVYVRIDEAPREAILI